MGEPIVIADSGNMDEPIGDGGSMDEPIVISDGEDPFLFPNDLEQYRANLAVDTAAVAAVAADDHRPDIVAGTNFDIIIHQYTQSSVCLSVCAI